MAALLKTDGKGLLLLNESLVHYNTWRVGGQAKALYKPADLADLSRFLKASSKDEPILFLGLGSNSLISDQGFSGTVIVTQSCLNEMDCVGPNLIRVEAGVSCAKLARFSVRHALEGGEFWAGIPGTMGGALRMNAGCFQGETWDSVVQVETIDRDGSLRIRYPNEFQISYRQVLGLENEWFVAATFRLVPGDKEKSSQRIKELLARRAATQPTDKYNCGSVFRNPPGHYAAQLIESCGLKGKRIGGAMVSEKHANFIINDEGLASATEIEDLMQAVQDEVYEKTAVLLKREVHFIGDASC